VPKKKESVRAQKGAATEHWKQEPDDHDFPAAADYLSLLADIPCRLVDLA
jgi:hypothetical protein